MQLQQFAALVDDGSWVDARIDRDPLNGNRITEIRSGPVNLSYRKVTGIDANLRHSLDTDRWGRFTTTLTWSHILTHETKARDDSPLVNYRDLNATVDFRSRASVQVDWMKGDWSSSLYVYRAGSIGRWILTNSLVTSGQLDARAPAFTQANISVGKRFTENLSMRVNVNNVLDDHGPDDVTFNSYPYTWYGYNALQGRSVGLQLDYRF